MCTVPFSYRFPQSISTRRSIAARAKDLYADTIPDQSAEDKAKAASEKDAGGQEEGSEGEGVGTGALVEGAGGGEGRDAGGQEEGVGKQVDMLVEGAGGGEGTVAGGNAEVISESVPADGQDEGAGGQDAHINDAVISEGVHADGQDEGAGGQEGAAAPAAGEAALRSCCYFILFSILLYFMVCVCVFVGGRGVFYSFLFYCVLFSLCVPGRGCVVLFLGFRVLAVIRARPGKPGPLPPRAGGWVFNL